MNFPSISPIAINLGPVSITWYGISYVLGLLIARFYLIFLSKKNFHTIKKNSVDDLFGNSIIGIIIGGRLGYVLFYKPDYFFLNTIEIFYIWQGGMSFHGGLIGVSIAIILTSIKQKIPLFYLSDMTALVAPIGLFFGRIANFINGELYGRVTNNFLGIIFPNGGDLPRHPSQLYEAFFEGIILFLILNLLFFLTKSRKLYGLLTAVFLILYGISRFFIEFLREPDAHLGFILANFSLGQLLCVPMILVGIIFLFVIFSNVKST